MADNNQKIQEMQFLEQNFQNLILQKQAFQMELAETQLALKEIEGSGDEIFKIVGQLMIKADKEKSKQELSNKEKVLGLRVSAIEKQETALTEQLEKLREEIVKSVDKKKE